MKVHRTWGKMLYLERYLQNRVFRLEGKCYLFLKVFSNNKSFWTWGKMLPIERYFQKSFWTWGKILSIWKGIFTKEVLNPTAAPGTGPSTPSPNLYSFNYSNTNSCVSRANPCARRDSAHWQQPQPRAHMGLAIWNAQLHSLSWLCGHDDVEMCCAAFKYWGVASGALIGNLQKKPCHTLQGIRAATALESTA